MYYEVESFAEAYYLLRQDLLKASIVSPRALPTKELLGVSIRINNPRNRLGYHADRGFSLPFAVAEAIALFNISNKLAPMEYINPRIKRFSDDGKIIYGMYGPRINTYIQDALRKLQDDTNTRQAVLPIFRPYDLRTNTKDVPCTINFQLLIRENKLHLFVNMRSNDLIWGTSYDIFSFTVFQEVLANTLGLELGFYQHTVTSLHVYEHHFELIEKIESMRAVEFHVPYVLEDMESLGTFLHVLKQYQFGQNTASGLFEHILLHHHFKKQHQMFYANVPAWALDFLK